MVALNRFMMFGECCYNGEKRASLDMTAETVEGKLSLCNNADRFIDSLSLLGDDLCKWVNYGYEDITT